MSGLIDDFDGRSRPVGAGPDIGAFEYGATGGGTSIRPSSWGALKAKYR